MIWAIGMVRNEEDVIGDVIAHLLSEGVEHVVVADNMSTDQTRAILEGFVPTNRVTIVDDPVVAYMQSAKMNSLVSQARAAGARWIVPFDADELWISRGGTLAGLLARHSDADVVVGSWYEHFPTLLSSRDPFRRMVMRKVHPNELGKVAFRPLDGLSLTMGNHDVEADVPVRRVREPALEIHHYPFRTFRQMVLKVRHGRKAIELANLDERTGWHWRRLGQHSTSRLLLTWVKLTLMRRGRTRDPQLPRSRAKDWMGQRR